jgi:hypothetical protein
MDSRKIDWFGRKIWMEFLFRTVTSFLAPPICAIYLLAILWKRINEEVGI